MTTADFRPTHVVPQDGLPAWEAPDVDRPTTPLDALLPVRLVDRLGDWGRIVCANGWSAWVDGRLLIAVPRDPPGAGGPLTRTADPRPLLARAEDAVAGYRRAAEELADGSADGETFRRRTRGLRVGVVVDGESVWLYDAEHERWVYCDGAQLSTYAAGQGPSAERRGGEGGDGDEATAVAGAGPGGRGADEAVGAGGGDAGGGSAGPAGPGPAGPGPAGVIEAVERDQAPVVEGVGRDQAQVVEGVRPGRAQAGEAAGSERTQVVAAVGPEPTQVVGAAAPAPHAEPTAVVPAVPGTTLVPPETADLDTADLDTADLDTTDLDTAVPGTADSGAADSDDVDSNTPTRPGDG